MKILDACCGGKMFWYEKNLEFVDFQDNRELQAELCDGRTFSVEPDAFKEWRRYGVDHSKIRKITVRMAAVDRTSF